MSLAWTGVERRRVTRKTLEQTVMLSLPGKPTITPCKMLNLSVLGACVRLKSGSILSTDFRLSFDEFRTSFDCRLVWRREDRAGISFVC
ncbi:PilZ domain-containing protein [Bradyrhizobium sp. ISRA442]|uniref:PilZ domain-containing protein n=1 Tax=Bradyrhizobium sp. ISRA442 TaxID=2866197 RepID=UPI00404B3B49